MQPKELTPSEATVFLRRLADACDNGDIGLWVAVGTDIDTVPPETFVTLTSSSVNKDKAFERELMAAIAYWDGVE